ncbi:MAG: aminotransferase class V-fold PLP-dependent enzyme [Chloroflexi bacterium]|nr:aminotransferase class V-fold PLP-dependent enzyme [Chloroflexota bacterium]
MDITHLRSQIPATRNVVYLNTGWSGPSPTAVVERIRDWLEFENTEGPTAPHVLEQRRGLQQDAREAVARLLNASPDEIALTQNTSEGINIVLNGMTWRPGDELITTNLEHSSGIVPCYYLASRRRVRLKIVDIVGVDDPSEILEKLEAAIKPRTRVILLSHVMYLTGLRLPLKGIQDMAHEHGIPVLVDAAQSVGQMPLDMKEMGCDFYSIPGHKWLLGPDGTGALYIRRDLIPQIRPYKVAHHAAADVNLHGHWRPEAESIKKFELTTTSAPLWAGLSTAIDFLQGIGLKEVQERVLYLSALAADRLGSLPGVTILSPRHPRLRSGLMTFSVDGVDPQKAVSHLWETGKIVCRSVDEPAGVRLSLDFFSTEEEIEKVVDCLKGLRQ